MVTAGTPNSPLVGYFQARNCLIAFNTIVNSRGPCIEVAAGLGSSGRTLIPEGIVVANNLFAGLPGEPLVKGTEAKGYQWLGNLVDTSGGKSDHIPTAELGLARGDDDQFRSTPLPGDQLIRWRSNPHFPLTKPFPIRHPLPHRAQLATLAVMARSKKEDPVPDSKQFREALLTLRSRFSTGHHAMLKAHCRAAGRRLTPAQLAKAARYPKHITANLHYNKLGKLIGEHLQFTPPMRKRNDDAIWANVLATPTDAPVEKVGEPDFVWTLRPELAEALLSLPWGIVPPKPEE